MPQINSNVPLQNNMPAYQYDDGVEVRELLKVIWSYKWLTLVMCVIAMAGSVFYALNAQEWWVAEGKIIEPQLNDVATLYSQTERVSAILATGATGADIGVSTPADALSNLYDPERLFKNFVNEFNSSQNKKQFLESSTVFTAFLATKEAQEEEAKLSVLNDWMSEIKAVKTKKQHDVKIYFKTTTKLSSALLLKDYANYVINKVKKNQFEKLSLFIDSQKKKLTVSIDIMEQNTQLQLKRLILKTQYAYQIADKSDLNTYKTNMNQTEELFEISSGTKTLKAKLDVLKSIADLSIIEPSLSTMKMTLTSLNKLEFVEDMHFSPLRYIENIEPPLNRAAPKAALIVILSTLMAGLLSIFIALLLNFLTKKEKN